METRESKVHSFIIKIWLEEVGDEAEKPFWRAYITHVPSGERRYLKGLDDVEDFIEPYLANLDNAAGRGSSFDRLKRRLSFGKTRRFH